MQMEDQLGRMNAQQLRRLATEFSLPKDVASFLVSQAQTTKDELFRIVAREMREFLESINLGAELTKILDEKSSGLLAAKRGVRIGPGATTFTFTLKGRS